LEPRLGGRRRDSPALAGGDMRGAELLLGCQEFYVFEADFGGFFASVGLEA